MELRNLIQELIYKLLSKKHFNFDYGSYDWNKGHRDRIPKWGILLYEVDPWEVSS
jgi:hypothetical protein